MNGFRSPSWLTWLLVIALASCTPGDAATAETKKIVALPADGPMLKADDPPAPAGWSAQPGVTATKFQDDANPLNVFRLYQPAVFETAIEDWFEGRRRTLPSGVDKARIVDEIVSESGLYVGYARAEQAGVPIAVVSYACASGGGARYGELITSQDESIAAPANKTSLALFTDLCRDGFIAAVNVANGASRTESEKAANSATPKPVASGKALKEKDIALVLYSWEQIYRVTGLALDEYAYLLIKDGSVRRELPVQAPDDFDVAADRAANPSLWGQWKKRGKEYQLTFDGEPFTPPGQVARLPGKKGQRLQLYYEDSWSVNYGQTGAVKFWGVQMNKDGTFKRNSHGSAGGVLGYGDTAVGTHGVYDDKGSSTSVSADNFGGGSSSSTGVTDADLTGTYEIDGYTLTLKYNNGQTIRSFFYVSDDATDIWFEGDELSYINTDD